MDQIRKITFLAVGWIFLFIGVIGIFVPLLPTTPFLLLAAYFFNRSSDKFHLWLLNHQVLGPPIRNWVEKRVISRQSKLIASVVITSSMIFVGMSAKIPVYGKASAAVILFGVLIFLWCQKSEPKI
jgi:uncharacterized membrane protein YbaN (DUF454 family)